MNKVKVGLSVAFCAVLVVGCAKELGSTSGVPDTLSNVIVTTSYDPEASFSNEGAFIFIVCQREFDPALGVDYATVDNRVRMAVQKELMGKGFKYSAIEDPRYHVVCDVVVDPEYERAVLNEYDEDWVTALNQKGYVRGALVITFRNADSPKPIWVGVFNGDILRGEVSEQEKNERVAFAVGQLLKDFPPQ